MMTGRNRRRAGAARLATTAARLAATGLVAALLAACGTSPTKLSLDIAASGTLNPNSEQQPSPVVLRVYELKTPDGFNGAGFFDLFDNDTKTLGGDLLGKREFEIAPGQKTTYNNDISPESQYVGILAGYRDIDNATWRTTAPVKAETTNSFVLRLEQLAVSLSVPSSWWSF